MGSNMVFSIDEVYQKNSPRGNLYVSDPYAWTTTASEDISIVPATGQTLSIREMIVFNDSFVLNAGTFAEMVLPENLGTTNSTVTFSTITDLASYTVDKQGNATTFMVFKFEPAITMKDGLSYATFEFKKGSGFDYSTGTMTFYFKGWKVDTSNY